MSQQTPTDTASIKPAPVTPATPPDVAGLRDDFNIDDLIPEELRTAFDDTPPAEEDSDDGEQDSSKEVEEPSDPANVENILEAEEEPGEDDEDLDLSPEAIDKLIEGDLEATKKKEKEADTPFWHEDEEYKTLTQRLKKLGIKEDKIDNLIQKVSDKRVTDNANILSGLEDQLEQEKKEKESLATQLQRLKAVERSAHFDTAQETQDKFVIPMQESAREVSNIFNREGIGVPLNDFFAKRNITEAVKLLEGVDLPDKDLANIRNQWRNYKELETSYLAARSSAEKDLKKALNSKISQDTVINILRNSLASIIPTDPKYSYIREAIQDDISKHEDVSNAIGTAKSNFQNIVSALEAPSEYLHNERWLEELGKFMYDAAHNKLMEKRLHDLTVRNKKVEDSFKKFVKHYKKLASSAGGIIGSNGVAKGPEAKNSKSTKKEEDKTLREFEALLKNPNKITEILPGS